MVSIAFLRKNSRLSSYASSISAALKSDDDGIINRLLYFVFIIVSGVFELSARQLYIDKE